MATTLPGRATLSRRGLVGGALAAVAAAGAVVGTGVRAPLGGTPLPQAAGAGIGAVTAPATLTAADLAAAGRVDYVLARLTARQAWSGAAAVARQGQVLLRKGYAWADLGLRASNSPSTRYRIASLTKQFTAMCILQLQDRGRLRVQDPIARYVDQAPEAWQAITLHQLLTHTSGIPDSDTLPSWPTVETRSLTPLQLIDTFREAPLLFPPGTSYSYSDSNYVLLGFVTMRLSDLPYAQYLERHILGPLGMRDTGYDAGYGRSPAHATGYARWGQPAAPQDMSALYAAGALFSTTDDLQRWDRALLRGSPHLVSPAALRAMFHPYVRTQPADPASPAYGYGWVIDTYRPASPDAPQRRMFWHPGDVNGFHALNALFPDSGHSVVLLSNLESTDLTGVLGQVAAALLA
jgi:CubicO group peptidase (beta-lactamase class C family)